MSGLPLLWKGEVCSSEELNGESRAEVYWVLLQLALARGESCVLAFAGDSLRFRFDNGIWFSSLARRTISPAVECLLPPNNGDIGIKSVTPAYLEVDVLMLDMPPTIPPSSMQDLAHRILTENNLYDRRVSLRDKGLQARTEYVHTKFFDNPEKRSFFRRLLSCFIEGGLEWMKSASAILWKVLAPEPVGDHMSEGLFWAGVEINRSAESGIYKATQSLLQSPGTQEHGCEGNEYFEPVLKLLTLITDVRFLEFLQLQALVRVSSKDDYGIVPMPKPGRRLAVPIALASEACTALRRCWILKVYDETNTDSWIIENKVHLLGCKTITADENFVIKRTIEVYGETLGSNVGN